VKFCPIQIAVHQTGGLFRHGKFGLISNEVLAMALLRDDPGVPKLYAVYAHGCTFITVMELFGVWPNTDELENLPPFKFTDDVADVVRLRPCDGMELWGPDCYIPGHKITEEMDVCKMSTIHLSTIQLMKDRGCSHDDIAHSTLIINEKYDACCPLPSPFPFLSVICL
jgi:hypothetical protein